ncbi:MAG: sigma-70 family RNA polymerase sigma factor, partial [Planctomycetota bacterium]|nr:sigma-70 family RNA polymerase sigma factor [Planctomycetota bacterium]
MTEHDELLRHQAFLRRLTRSLVVDPDRADDLTQEAWLAALQRPPRAIGALWHWLSRVARNLAIDGATSERRRGDRERAVARPEGVPSTEAMNERLALQRRVVEAVEGLREPYRTAIFLRYFEELRPGAIAERQGIPVGTVKTRLRRGLELLREALDRCFGDDRSAWSVALAGAFRELGTAGATTTLVGGTAMGVKIAAGLAGAGAVALGYVMVLNPSVGEEEQVQARAAEPEVVEPAVVDPVDPEVDPLAPLVSGEASAPRAVVDIDPAPTEAEREDLGPVAPAKLAGQPIPPPQQDGRVIYGRVLDPGGRPVEDALVVFGPDSDETDDRGRFYLAVRERNQGWGSGDRPIDREDALVATFEGFAPVIVGGLGEKVIASEGAIGPIDIFLADTVQEITGWLVTADGAPATGWRIKLLDGVVVSANSQSPVTAEDLAAGVANPRATDDEGRFAFTGLAPHRTYRLRTWNEKTLEIVASEPIPAGTFDYVFQVPQPDFRPTVDGVVVGLDGRPLENVRCRLTMVEHEDGGATWMTTGQELRTGPDGRFEFTDVPHTDLFIRFNGHGGGTSFDLPPDEPGRDLYVEIVREGGFRFEARNLQASPTSVSVLDEAGERL